MSARARNALIGAGGLSVLLFATWFGAFHVPVVEHADASIFDGFIALATHPHVDAVASRIANVCDPSPYVFLCLVPLLMAIVRRRFTLAIAIGVILLGANLTTHILKPLLAAPRPSDGNQWWLPGRGSWPSGHATASMTLALCTVLASPGRLRPVAAALGGAFAVAVTYSFLVLGWHYPSDALGGFLVATIWTLLGVAGVEIVQAHPRRRTERGGALDTAHALTPPALALFAALIVAEVVVLARPDAVLSYGDAHRWFVVGAAALGALGLSLSTGVMLTLRR
jgi:membrane-associated phospholipid phosphatase